MELYQIYFTSNEPFPEEWRELSLRLALEQAPEREDLKKQLQEILLSKGAVQEAAELGPEISLEEQSVYTFKSSDGYTSAYDSGQLRYSDAGNHQAAAAKYNRQSIDEGMIDMGGEFSNISSLVS